jgi:hypothetical protein
VLYRIIQIWPSGTEPRDSASSSEGCASLGSIAERRKHPATSKGMFNALCAGEIVMANSNTGGATCAQITAEHLSEDEPHDLLKFHQLKSSRNSHQRARPGRDMWTPPLSEIKSQNDQADGNRLKQQRKMIGQKSDNAKSKLLKRELLSREGKVLQTLYSAVRSRPAPPTT